MRGKEEIIEYECSGNRVYGVLHTPAKQCGHGLLMIGRTGSDRQAVYLARSAREHGLTAFRFDFRGRGDCEGPVVSVEQTAQDLACALQTLQSAAPEIATVTIWGLSEGAAAALLYAHSDPRVTGLVLVNPWIRMEQAVAKQHLKQNVARVWDPNFWNRIKKSEAGFRGAARSFSTLVTNVVRAPRTATTLKDRVIDGFARFTGQVCIILSGEDPATAVFQQAAAADLEKLVREDRLVMRTLPEANHVFSRVDWRLQLVTWSVDWVADRMAGELCHH